MKKLAFPITPRAHITKAMYDELLTERNTLQFRMRSLEKATDETIARSAERTVRLEGDNKRLTERASQQQNHIEHLEHQLLTIRAVVWRQYVSTTGDPSPIIGGVTGPVLVSAPPAASETDGVARRA